MGLHRIEFRETGNSSRAWASFDELTRNKNPVAVARRYLRLVNHVANKPGGYDQVLSGARVYRVGVWPEGDTFLREVRAEQTPAEKERIRQRRTRAVITGLTQVQCSVLLTLGRFASWGGLTAKQLADAMWRRRFQRAKGRRKNGMRLGAERSLQRLVDLRLVIKREDQREDALASYWLTKAGANVVEQLRAQ